MTKACKDCKHSENSYVLLGLGCQRKIKRISNNRINGKTITEEPLNRKCSKERAWWGYLFARCGLRGQFWEEKSNYEH